MQHLAGKEADLGKQYYLGIAKKIVEKGEQYVEGEIARLEGMLASDAVQPESKTGFQIKRNVLAAFVAA